jgi:hypothetical protein
MLPWAPRNELTSRTVTIIERAFLQAVNKDATERPNYDCLESIHYEGIEGKSRK